MRTAEAITGAHWVSCSAVSPRRAVNRSVTACISIQFGLGMGQHLNGAGVAGRASPAPFRCCPMPKPNCMDIQAVTERLTARLGETAEQLTQWAPVIASAVRMVELRMFDGTDPADERLTPPGSGESAAYAGAVPVVPKRRRCDRLYRRRCNGADKAASTRHLP